MARHVFYLLPVYKKECDFLVSKMTNGANDHTTECTFMRRLRQTLARMELRVACVRKKETSDKKQKDG